jgi:RNA polymerase sigma factor (sigma-70 family)
MGKERVIDPGFGRHELLTREGEVELFKKIEAGKEAEIALNDNSHTPYEENQLKAIINESLDAREDVVLHNVGLVISIAKKPKYKQKGLDFEDLVQEGFSGLLKAIDKFEYQRGNKFSTYATYWINQAIGRAIEDQGLTIRLPVWKNQQIGKYIKTVNELRQKLGREPTAKEVANKLEISEKRVKSITNTPRATTSIDKAIMSQDEESSYTLLSFLEDTTSPGLQETIEQKQTARRLREVLNQIDPKQAQILRQRYGLNGNGPKTLQEVGDKLGVSREAIRQVEQRALKKLRMIYSFLQKELDSF